MVPDYCFRTIIKIRFPQGTISGLADGKLYHLRIRKRSAEGFPVQFKDLPTWHDSLHFGVAAVAINTVIERWNMSGSLRVCRVMIRRRSAGRLLKIAAMLTLFALAGIGARMRESAQAQSRSTRQIDFNRDI